MAFITKEWKDRIVEYAGRRKLVNVSDQSEMIVDVTRNEGTVSQAGDAFSAANMNDLEQRVADEFSAISENLTANDGSVFRYATVDGKDGRIRTVDGADTFFPFKSEPKPLSVETPNFTTASSFTQTINCEVGNIIFVAVGLNANDSMSSIQMSVTGATAINDSYSSKAGTAGAIVGCIYKADATTVTINVSASGDRYRRYMPYICVCE